MSVSVRENVPGGPGGPGIPGTPGMPLVPAQLKGPCGSWHCVSLFGWDLARMHQQKLIRHRRSNHLANIFSKFLVQPTR